MSLANNIKLASTIGQQGQLLHPSIPASSFHYEVEFTDARLALVSDNKNSIIYVLFQQKLSRGCGGGVRVEGSATDPEVLGSIPSKDKTIS